MQSWQNSAKYLFQYLKILVLTLSLLSSILIARSSYINLVLLVIIVSIKYHSKVLRAIIMKRILTAQIETWD